MALSTQHDSKSIRTVADPQIKNSFTVSYASPGQRARRDFAEGIQKWRIWLLLAWQDIRLRYRRSVLGPFWITLSMAITTYSMGYLYSHLFHVDLQTYFPFLVAGMLAWSLVSSLAQDLAEAFIASEGLMKQIRLPFSLYIHRVATRNMLIFFHNIIVIFPILAIFHQKAHLNLNFLLLVPGLLILHLNAICFGLVLAMVGARYRDINQIVKSLIQVIFFLTPIMWDPALLPESKRWIVFLNPFYTAVELIRPPLTGHAPRLLFYGIALGVTAIGMATCLHFMKKFRARIIYWL